MRHGLYILLLAAAIPFAAQTASPPPQTARQALIEMFTSKDSASFEKHIPEEARQALVRKGDTLTSSLMLRLASLGEELSSGGKKLETFDNGPTLAVSQQSDRKKTGIPSIATMFRGTTKSSSCRSRTTAMAKLSLCP